MPGAGGTTLLYSRRGRCPLPEQLNKLALRFERDVVKARQRARQIAGLLGFDPQEQIRVATATSEIARNAFRYATAGTVEFLLELEPPQHLVICVEDAGPGIPNLQEILDGEYKSRTGMGMGIIGTRRLMDRFEIRTGRQGTSVTFQAALPKRKLPVGMKEIEQLADRINRSGLDDPLEELERQNQELLKTLATLHSRQEELARANRELEDTNRGVVALYAELDERADALRRASDLKTSFLSNMSHEFRTPLNSVLSLARMLLDRMDGDLSPEQEKQVRYIQKSALDLLEMVNDLLDLAKVEAGKVEIRPKQFTVGELFGALRGMLKPLLQDNSLNLVFVEPEDLPTMITDQGKVSQILRNFISNALKFTQRGEIRVSASMLDHGVVAFSVSDTGIGIAPEDTEKIFQEFMQIESAMQRRVKGTGLGLPLSRNLARLLGGDVTVTSAPGLGSTFSALIPVIYADLNVEEALTVPEIPVLGPGELAVLLVEDNRETAFLLENYLKRSEFRTVTAYSLHDARRVLEQLRPAAIVLDIILQGEPCWGLVKEIREKFPPNLPILAISVSPEATRSLAAGANAFLQKPIDPAALLHHLRELTVRSLHGKVLLIDDNEVSRYLLRKVLPEATVEILEARSGREGLQEALAHRPTVIFLDLIMPDLSGFEVLRELRADERTREIPVVIHSSHSITQAEQEKIAYPSVAVWSKSRVEGEQAAEELCSVLGSLGMDLGKQIATHHV